MNYQNVLSYNKRSAQKYNWDPSWFGAEDFNKDFLDKVLLYQKEHNLTQDGLVGPSTYRRVFLEREATISDYRPSRRVSCRDENVIVHNSEMFPIKWDKVILSAKSGNSIYIPGGCAHGFLTLESNSKLYYLIDKKYNKKNNIGFIYNDKNIGINWPNKKFIISKNDKKLKEFKL